MTKTFLINIEQKAGKIRKVLNFENEIEHKILVTYVIAKVSARSSEINFQTTLPTILIPKIHEEVWMESGRSSAMVFRNGLRQRIKISYKGNVYEKNK